MKGNDQHCHLGNKKRLPGQTLLMPAPLPSWDGVEYVDSAALPTFRTGDGVGPSL